MKKFILLLCLILISTPVFAKHTHLEKEYQKAWCSAHQGIPEFKNADLTRTDCITNDYAIEFDFADKWAESIGQSLYYSIVNHRKPAIVLISENGKKDIKYIERAKTVAKQTGIDVWFVDANYLKSNK